MLPAGRLAAVNVQRLAGYERRSLEIEDRVDDVADFADAPQRVEGLEPVVGRGVVVGCLDDPERDRVDADAARGVFDRQRTAGRDESSLGEGR